MKLGSEFVKARTVAVTVLTFTLFAPLPGQAQMFTACVPNEQAWRYQSSDTARAEAQAREVARCQAVNDAQAAWTPRLQTLSELTKAMDRAVAAQDWAMLRSSFADAKAPLLELQALAVQHPEAQRTDDLRFALGAGMADRFRNSGFAPAASLDDAFRAIDVALGTPGKQVNAATVAINLTGTIAQLAREMAASLAEQSGTVAAAQLRKIAEAAGARRADQIQGVAPDTYVGGLGTRFKLFSSIVLGWTFLAFVIGAFVGSRSRRPGVMLKAPVIAFGVATPIWLLVVVLPFIPAWIYGAAGLVGFWLLWTWTERLLAPWSAFFHTQRRGSAAAAPVGLQGAAGASPPTTPQTHGSALWGTVQDMTARGRIALPGRPLPEPGFALGRIKDAPPGADSRFRYLGHVLTCAPTGAGKGVGAVIPNLLEYPGSALVLDIKGENVAVTARARRELGHQVFVVDPFGVTGGNAHAFNLLDRLDVGHPDCVSESAALADCLVIVDKEGANHFDETAKNLLQGLMLYVAALPDRSQRHLGELRRLLTSDEDTLMETLADMASDESRAFGIPARAANTLMGTGDRERGSILSTARRNTAFLDDPRIVAAVSRSDFGFDRLKSELVTIYVVMPPAKLAANARFIRGLVGSALASITADHRKPAHKVVFFLDEFAQLGRMAVVEDSISLVRGYGAAFWIFVQDLSQLKGVYPKWGTFLANSAKQFYGTADFDTAKYISDSLGQATIEFETQNAGRNSGSGVSGGGGSLNKGSSSGQSQQFTGRALLTPDEVMRLGAEPIVMINGEPPYLLGRLSYLNDADYEGRFDANPYHA